MEKTFFRPMESVNVAKKKTKKFKINNTEFQKIRKTTIDSLVLDFLFQLILF